LLSSPTAALIVGGIVGKNGMPRLASKALSDAELKSGKRLKTPGLYADGGCPHLYVEVKPDGSRYWCFRFTLAGRTRQMGLGPTPPVRGSLLLSQAREEVLRLRALVRQGIDPIAQRQADRSRVDAKPRTFREAAELCIAAKECEWRNSKHRQQWRNTLATYAYSALGNRPVADITTEDVLAAVEPIWRTKTETASRLRGRIEAVLNYAKARGWRNGDNPAAWRGNLADVLPKRSKVAPVEHEPALGWALMPEFLAKLRALPGLSARALELAILTAARSGMVLNAVWPEFNLDQRTWTVPARRMKANREHRIPLSDSAQAVLQALLPLRNPEAGDWVFPGGKERRPLSDMSMVMVLRGMNEPIVRWRDAETGEPIVPHGFRSTFRDWARDNAQSAEAAEAALAHEERNKTVRAYARSDLFEQRKTLMQEWAMFCEPTEI
jgi:integrase